MRSICVFSNARRLRVELRAHQIRPEMDDMDFDAVLQQTARRLQPQQPAADHNGALAFVGASGDLMAVVERAEHADAGLIVPRGRLQPLHRRDVYGRLPVAMMSVS